MLRGGEKLHASDQASQPPAGDDTPSTSAALDLLIAMLWEVWSVLTQMLLHRLHALIVTSGPVMLPLSLTASMLMMYLGSVRTTGSSQQWNASGCFSNIC